MLGSPGTVITDSCWVSCGCCELNQGPLQQPMLLTAEPFLQQDLVVLCLVSKPGVPWGPQPEPAASSSPCHGPSWTCLAFGYENMMAWAITSKVKLGWKQTGQEGPP